MKAIDTNVAARFLLNDDPDQAELARLVIEQPTYISVTVLLELSWLLTSRYGLARAVVANALTQLIDVPNVTVSNVERVRWALARFAGAGDIADLLHLAVAGGVESFVTFDRGVASAAGPDSPVRVETLG